jgi:hypothetical protein
VSSTKNTMFHSEVVEIVSLFSTEKQNNIFNCEKWKKALVKRFIHVNPSSET